MLYTFAKTFCPERMLGSHRNTFTFRFCVCDFNLILFIYKNLFCSLIFFYSLYYRIFLLFYTNNTNIPPLRAEKKPFCAHWFCSCPAGFKMSGTQCVNENECLWQPCQNGGVCTDLNPPRKYECDCPFGYTGMNCELELLASGVLTPSRDFIIAIIICASTLICK